ncbi:hypothetical protein EIP91_003652 [Steccherinum ochraceum]|uniref:Uncharacterized protein n=1 Tax=Steccherinum ochraceum TaxID=92696 RepID=A0A4R0RA51_9APHY|nr:hypothetical protein EIP91_003652 [Steccherinum ochraceum]
MIGGAYDLTAVFLLVALARLYSTIIRATQTLRIWPLTSGYEVCVSLIAINQTRPVFFPLSRSLHVLEVVGGNIVSLEPLFELCGLFQSIDKLRIIQLVASTGGLDLQSTIFSRPVKVRIGALLYYNNSSQADWLARVFVKGLVAVMDDGGLTSMDVQLAPQRYKEHAAFNVLLSTRSLNLRTLGIRVDSVDLYNWTTDPAPFGAIDLGQCLRLREIQLSLRLFNGDLMTKGLEILLTLPPESCLEKLAIHVTVADDTDEQSLSAFFSHRVWGKLAEVLHSLSSFTCLTIDFNSSPYDDGWSLPTDVKDLIRRRLVSPAVKLCIEIHRPADHPVSG